MTFDSPDAERQFAQHTLEMSAFRDTTFTAHLIRDERGHIVRSEVVLTRQGHELPSVEVEEVGLLCARRLIDGVHRRVIDGLQTGVQEAHLMMAIPWRSAAAPA